MESLCKSFILPLRLLSKLLQRHRFSFFVFRLAPNFPLLVQVDFLIVDGDGWDSKQLESKMREETYRPFDIVNGSVFHVRFFRTSSGTFVPPPPPADSSIPPPDPVLNPPEADLGIGGLVIMAHHISIGWLVT